MVLAYRSGKKYIHRSKHMERGPGSEYLYRILRTHGWYAVYRQKYDRHGDIEQSVLCGAWRTEQEAEAAVEAMRC